MSIESIPGVEFVPLESNDKNWKTNTPLKRYAVVHNGEVVGAVFQHMATMERKIPGKRYVASRWYSMRWAYEVPGEPGRLRGRSGYETRKQAASYLTRA